MMAAGLTKERGAAIQFHALEPCGRTFLAQSVYEPLPPTVPLDLRLAAGPQWLVMLCDPRGSAVRVAVAALATHVSIQDGKLAYPMGPLLGFVPRGVPTRVGNEVLPPERAVVALAARTGTRVSAVPELLAPPVGRSPHNSAWRISLDSATEVRTSTGNARRVTELFARMQLDAPGNLTVTALDGAPPATDEVRVPLSPDENGRPLGFTTYQLELKPGMPLELVRVEEKRPEKPGLLQSAPSWRLSWSCLTWRRSCER